MALFLCIETSSVNCSVSLFDNLNLIGSIESAKSYQHAERLHVYIEGLLQKKGVEFKDLKAVAVGAGPGSFTGLRIGVAAAKGLCYSLDIPLISASSLKSMASQVLYERAGILNTSKKVLLRPLIDARRMEVYTAGYDQNLDLISEISASIIDENSFISELQSGTVVFFGDGMSKVREIYASWENAIFIDEILPSSVFMIEEVVKKFKSSQFEDTAYFEPFYLKDFQPTTPKRKC